MIFFFQIMLIENHGSIKMKENGLGFCKTKINFWFWKDIKKHKTEWNSVYRINCKSSATATSSKFFSFLARYVFFSPAHCAISWCHIKLVFFTWGKWKKNPTQNPTKFFIDLTLEFPFWKYDLNFYCEFTIAINNHLTDLKYFEISFNYFQYTSHM